MHLSFWKEHPAFLAGLNLLIGTSCFLFGKRLGTGFSSPFGPFISSITVFGPLFFSRSAHLPTLFAYIQSLKRLKPPTDIFPSLPCSPIKPPSKRDSFIKDLLPSMGGKFPARSIRNRKTAPRPTAITSYRELSNKEDPMNSPSKRNSGSRWETVSLSPNFVTAQKRRSAVF